MARRKYCADPQCSNLALPGERYCSLHLVVSDDPEEVLKSLMRESDKRVRLRATMAYTNLLRERKRTSCRRCAVAAEKEAAIEDVVKRCTPEQSEQLLDLLTQVKELRAVIAQQPLYQHPEDAEK